MFHFYIPQKHQEIRDFLTFPGEWKSNIGGNRVI